MATLNKEKVYTLTVFSKLNMLREQLPQLSTLLTKEQLLEILNPDILKTFDKVSILVYNDPVKYFQAQSNWYWKALQGTFTIGNLDTFNVNQEYLTRYIRNQTLYITRHIPDTKLLSEYDTFVDSLLSDEPKTVESDNTPKWYKPRSLPRTASSIIIRDRKTLYDILSGHENDNIFDAEYALQTAFIYEVAKLPWSDDQTTNFDEITDIAYLCESGTLEFIRAFRLANRHNYRTLEIPVSRILNAMTDYLDTHKGYVVKYDWTKPILALLLKYYEVDVHRFEEFLDTLSPMLGEFFVAIDKEAKNNTDW